MQTDTISPLLCYVRLARAAAKMGHATPEGIRRGAVGRQDKRICKTFSHLCIEALFNRVLARGNQAGPAGGKHSYFVHALSLKRCAPRRVFTSTRTRWSRNRLNLLLNFRVPRRTTAWSPLDQLCSKRSRPQRAQSSLVCREVRPRRLRRGLRSCASP
jgi:hypothetical protein